MIDFNEIPDYETEILAQAKEIYENERHTHVKAVACSHVLLVYLRGKLEIAKKVGVTAENKGYEEMIATYEKTVEALEQFNDHEAAYIITLLKYKKMFASTNNETIH